MCKYTDEDLNRKVTPIAQGKDNYLYNFYCLFFFNAKS